MAAVSRDTSRVTTKQSLSTLVWWILKNTLSQATFTPSESTRLKRSGSVRKQRITLSSCHCETLRALPEMRRSTSVPIIPMWPRMSDCSYFWTAMKWCNMRRSTCVPIMLMHYRVTAVARKRSRSFCQKCRWQVTAKHAYALRMWLCMKWHSAWLCGVHRTCAETAAVSCGTGHVSAVSTPLRWILKKKKKKKSAMKASHSCSTTCERSESAQKSGE